MALHSPATCCLAHPGFADAYMGEGFALSFPTMMSEKKNEAVLR